jgi:hypothetical protein
LPICGKVTQSGSRYDSCEAAAAPFEVAPFEVAPFEVAQLGVAQFVIWPSEA